jgi:hypothetical protein
MVPGEIPGRAVLGVHETPPLDLHQDGEAKWER